MTDDDHQATYRQTGRLSWATFEATTRGLLESEGLTHRGLLAVRKALTEGPWAPAHDQLPLPPDIAAQRSLLLHDVGRAALDAGRDWPHPEDLIYIIIPDDLSGTA